MWNPTIIISIRDKREQIYNIFSYIKWKVMKDSTLNWSGSFQWGEGWIVKSDGKLSTVFVCWQEIIGFACMINFGGDSS
jgi:hypothetical protein